MAGIGKRAAAGVSRAREWLMEYAYLVTLLAVVAIIAASALYTREVKQENERALQAAAQAAEIRGTPAPEITPLPTIAPLVLTKMEYAPRRVTVRPVSGEIIRGYTAEPVYYGAMSVFQAHEAIDLAGEAEEAVRCAMDGVVREAAMDALWGWRVRVEHTDGSVGTYAGLALSYVRAGQSVARGEEIGVLLGCVPCEAELGAHLHLELTRDGERQDPQGILPQ